MASASTSRLRVATSVVSDRLTGLAREVMTIPAMDMYLLAQALGLKESETPFPWQVDLLKRFMRGATPPALDIPTGLGKTSVMAIWLVARATGAPMPRRLVYIVDRRAVVDQATDVALGLRALVDQRPSLREPLGLSNDRSLPISTLRGQFVDNREWLEDPASPAIVVGTVDMTGSRLLFEGYGVSRKMRPYHAGLLGADTLVVLDEAHLVPPFEHVLRAVETERDLHPRDGCDDVVPRFRLLALSATGRAHSAGVLQLTQRDTTHDIVRKRLDARKSLHLEQLDESTKLSDALATRAWMLTGNGTQAVRVIVYSNSRGIAQQARDALLKLAKRDRKAGVSAVEIDDTELFVGARRVLEREQAKARLVELGFIAGSEGRARSAFLFATSAGEVGVDLDADHMVSDLVAWERMVQRLGRVNRRGDGEATVVVIVDPKPKASKKEQEALDKQMRGESLDGTELKRLQQYEAKVLESEHQQKPLRRLRVAADGGFDASPAALLDLRSRASTDPNLRQVIDDATSAEPLRPALSRPLVEAWAMTSLERHTGRPDVQPWLRGWVEDEPQTAVAWRIHLPVRAGGAVPRKKEIEDFFEAAPPHTSELLETETFWVVKWIAARAKSVIEQAERETAEVQPPRHRRQDVAAFALDPDGGLRKTFTLAELETPDDKKMLERLLSGATVVVNAQLGGLTDGLLDEKEDSMPRTADANGGASWLGEGVVGFRVRSIEDSAAATPQSQWRERFRFASELSEEGEARRWLVVEKWLNDAATEDDRSVATSQLLDEHRSRVEERARHLVEALALDGELASVLVLAARLHDEGKRSRLWQRAFNAQTDGVYAKTAGPINYRVLDGYRHELGSLLRVENHEPVTALPEEHRDLLLHLIAAHHGFARPVIGTNGCEEGPPSVLGDKAAAVALRFARLQDRWGPWGLAWLESLLRAADQQASRDAARGGA